MAGLLNLASQSLFVARFREAFAVAGMVYDDLEPPEVEGFSVLRPGFLRSNLSQIRNRTSCFRARCHLGQ
jgi:hypothetical protein